MAATKASNYTRMTGNCTALVASQMLHSIQPPITASSYILDNACGPGIVSAEIKALYPDAKIMATDLDPGMIAEVQTRIRAEDWKDVSTEVLDVCDLSTLKDGMFSHVFMNFALHGPGGREESVKAVREVCRVLQQGGVAMFSTWADRIWLNAFYATARTVRPHEALLTKMALSPEKLRGSWLLSLLEDSGFGNNVELRTCTTYTSADSLDELVDNIMLAKQMFFSGYSDEEMDKAKPIFKEELRKLRTFEEVDGGVRIGMKAWIGIGWLKGDEGEVPV